MLSSHHTTPYHIINHITSQHITTQHDTPHHITPHHYTLHLFLSDHTVISHRIPSHHTTSRPLTAHHKKQTDMFDTSHGTHVAFYCTGVCVCVCMCVCVCVCALVWAHPKPLNPQSLNWLRHPPTLETIHLPHILLPLFVGEGILLLATNSDRNPELLLTIIKVEPWLERAQARGAPQTPELPKYTDIIQKIWGPRNFVNPSPGRARRRGLDYCASLSSCLLEVSGPQVWGLGFCTWLPMCLVLPIAADMVQWILYRFWVWG